MSDSRQQYSPGFDGRRRSFEPALSHDPADEPLEPTVELSSSDERDSSEASPVLSRKRSRSDDRITETDMQFYRLARANAIAIWRMIPGYGDYINGALFQRFKAPQEYVSEYRQNVSEALGLDPATLAELQVKDLHKLLEADPVAKSNMPEISIYTPQDPKGFEGQGYEIDMGRMQRIANAGGEEEWKTAYQKDILSFVTEHIDRKREALGVESVEKRGKPDSVLGAYTTMIAYIGQTESLCDLIAESRDESVVSKGAIEDRMRNSGFVAAVRAQASACQGRNSYGNGI